jgi:hypothetical protein
MLNSESKVKLNQKVLVAMIEGGLLERKSSVLDQENNLKQVAKMHYLLLTNDDSFNEQVKQASCRQIIKLFTQNKQIPEQDVRTRRN